MKIEPLARCRLAYWAIQALQKYLGMADSARLKLNPDDPRIFHTSGDYKVIVIIDDADGYQISVYMDEIKETGKVLVWVDSLYLLARPGRQGDFDIADLAVPVEIDQQRFDVDVTSALDTLPLWETRPRNYNKQIPEHMRPFKVEGGIKGGSNFEDKDK